MVGWLDDQSGAEAAAESASSGRLSASMRQWLDKQRETAPSSVAARPRPATPSAPNSVLSVSHTLVALTECRGGCRPLLDELAARWQWRSAQSGEEAAANVLFTDIKRAGKRRCFKLVEDARQQRLTAMRAPFAASTSIACRAPPRTNCFPGMAEAVSKCSLARCLSAHQRLFPSDFDFFPVSYDLGTADGLSAASAYLSASAGSRALIVKPSRGSQGAGIVLVQHVHQLQSVLYASPDKRFVAQHYIHNPRLLGEHKFDLRVYVLLTSLSPLTLHVFQDGLARVCTEPYRRPSALNLSHTFAHLSNYSLNKHSNSFKPPTENQSQRTSTAPTAHRSASYKPSPPLGAAPFSTSPSIDLDDDASKRSICAALSQLAHQGTPVDTRRFWADVTELAEKTLLALTPTLWSAYSATFASAAEGAALGSACFHVLGFDCLLDDTNKLHLLEVNSAPSWATDSALDWRIKMSVMENSMHILGVNSDAPPPATAALQPESDDEPLTSRSVSSVSSTISSASASSCVSLMSRCSDVSISRRASIARSTSRLLSSSRPHANAHSARALRSNSLRRPSSSHSAHLPVHTTNLEPRPPLSFVLPTFDWRDLRHIAASASASTCTHLHWALCHPLLLSLYHHHAQPSGGLSPSTFRRLVALFTSSAPWCATLPAAETHLMFLQQTKQRGEAVVSFDGLCACLAMFRQRLVRGGVWSDRQEAAVWDQWIVSAHQRYVACTTKASQSLATVASATQLTRSLRHR